MLLLYRFVPARRLTFRDALAGAIVTALLLFAISLVSGIHLQPHAEPRAYIYGSLTLALVFLYSMYLYASALLLGAEVAAAWSRPVEVTGESLPRQIRRVVARPLRPPGSAARAGATRARADRSSLTVGL